VERSFGRGEKKKTPRALWQDKEREKSRHMSAAAVEVGEERKNSRTWSLRDQEEKGEKRGDLLKALQSSQRTQKGETPPHVGGKKREVRERKNGQGRGREKGRHDLPYWGSRSKKPIRGAASKRREEQRHTPRGAIGKGDGKRKKKKKGHAMPPGYVVAQKGKKLHGTGGLGGRRKDAKIIRADRRRRRKKSAPTVREKKGGKPLA